MKLSYYINEKTSIDISNWKDFKINDLFYFEKGKDSSPKKSESENIYGIPCAIAKNNNSGYGGYKNNPIKIYEGCKLLFVAQGDGGAGMCFVSNEKCCASKCVYVLRVKEKNILNKYNGLFIATIISKYKKYFNHTKGINNKFLENLTIKLPIDKNGEPDWKYMEDYIRERERENDLKNYLTNQLLMMLKNHEFTFDNIKKYKTFKLDDLFEISRGKRIVRNRDYTDNKTNENIYPVITPRLQNNGIDGFFNKYNCEGNVIVVGGDVSGMLGFYQDQKCWVVDTSRILKPKFKATKNVCIFLLSIIQKYNFKFNFQKKANPENIKKLTIILPINENNEPDWKYIDEFIEQKTKKILKYI